MNRNSLKQLFSDYYPVAGSTFEIALAKHFEVYCIVEGSDDRWFYSNLKDESKKNIFDNAYFVYQKHCADRNVLEGKKRVLKSYDLVNQSHAFDHLKKNMYFIVDKDLGDINQNKYQHLSITRYYAFENYFLLDNNLKSIFEALDLREKDLVDFQRMLNQYIERTNDYYKYSYLITYYHDKIHSVSLKKQDEKNILLFLDDNREFTENDFARLQIIDFEKMKDELQFKKQIIQYFHLDNNLFSNNSIYTIKGHHLYSFLEGYLKSVHHINLKNHTLYSKIVNGLHVEMDFMNCLGEKK